MEKKKKVHNLQARMSGTYCPDMSRQARTNPKGHDLDLLSTARTSAWVTASLQAGKAAARLSRRPGLNRAGAENDLGRWGWKGWQVASTLHVPGCWHCSTGPAGTQESHPPALQPAPHASLSPGVALPASS